LYQGLGVQRKEEETLDLSECSTSAELDLGTIVSFLDDVYNLPNAKLAKSTASLVGWGYHLIDVLESNEQIQALQDEAA